MTELADLARLAPDVDLDAATTQFRRASRRRRQRRLVANSSFVGLVVASFIGAAVVAAVTSRDDGGPVVAGPGPTGGTTTISSAGFGSHTITVRLPASLAPTYEIEELASSILIGGQEWRLEARRSDVVGDAVPTCATIPHLTATRHLDGWKIEISGDVERDDPCPGVLAELEHFAVAGGMPSYRGDGWIGPIDSPLWWARVGDRGNRLSVLQRECVERRGGASSGLVVSSAYDRARGTYLSVLCEDELGVVVLLDTTERPDPAALEAITIERATSEETRAMRSTRMDLFTHCGVRSLEHDGHLWIASPEVPDSGNGWGFNVTPGRFTIVGPDTARFDADSGVTAFFRRAAPGTPDPSQVRPCA
jgi:hypothetical protein